MAALGWAIFSFLFLFAVVAGLLIWRSRMAEPALLSLQKHLIWRSLLIGVGLLAEVFPEYRTVR